MLANEPNFFTPVRAIAAVVFLIFGFVTQGDAKPGCAAEQAKALVPNPALCAPLEAIVRKPGALPLHVYEAKLGIYLRNYCHRQRAAGWRSDKRVRATGPYVASTENEHVAGRDFGTHAPVLVWYSPEMMIWLHANRRDSRPIKAGSEPPIPDGAMMIKEMYPAPAATCAGADPLKLLPLSGAAVMVRDNETTRDGWFWGWFGWGKGEWQPDWPAPSASLYPNMGFGQYCVNCHASARENQTFSSLRNIEGETGEPLVYLSQNLAPDNGDESQHEAVAGSPTPKPKIVSPGSGSSFIAALGLGAIALPKLVEVRSMPPATYDNVWARPKGHPLDDFVTSDQCLGCHDAGSTGLQADMQERQPGSPLVVNVSPYGTWRSSPMGMAGRDPIFFAQLASETDQFHPKSHALVEDACLGCHGVLGQRAFRTKSKQDTGTCHSMGRDMLQATPFPDGDPIGALAEYAGLSRDGVSCVVCHRMALGSAAAQHHVEQQNSCLDERRAFLTPGLSGFAASFTGSFDMGPPDKLNGPFENAREMPMKHALGMAPAHSQNIMSSELCGSCHTVHLPILRDGAIVGYTYEQTTYAEWAFSAYRVGTSPDGPMPLGRGAQAQSCQGCHMPSSDAKGRAVVSKIASIQEFSNFPETENNLGPDDIDLPPRRGFAKHLLVGLNTIFVKMAQQFPELLGIRKQDPMLTIKAVDPLVVTERAMLGQATLATADVAVRDLKTGGGVLDATVTITNKTGHKFPSGVGFRRAFVEFTVRDAAGQVLWVSGQTNKAGVILDGQGKPLANEIWWTPDCATRIDPQGKQHQPHYDVITRQDQVQIYEDVSAAPIGGSQGVCTRDATGGVLTTSFLSRCTKVKDNRILPAGFLKLSDRVKIAEALGAKSDLAEESGSFAVGADDDYVGGGGADSLHYRLKLDALATKPATVEAKLFYQPTPPYYLQDRACTSNGADTKRLMFIAASLDLNGSATEGWKLKIASSGLRPVP